MARQRRLSEKNTLQQLSEGRGNGLRGSGEELSRQRDKQDQRWKQSSLAMSPNATNMAFTVAGRKRAGGRHELATGSEKAIYM